MGNWPFEMEIETAMPRVQQIPPPFLPGDTATPYFPVSPAERQDHMTDLVHGMQAAVMDTPSWPGP